MKSRVRIKPRSRITNDFADQIYRLTPMTTNVEAGCLLAPAMSRTTGSTGQYRSSIEKFIEDQAPWFTVNPKSKTRTALIFD